MLINGWEKLRLSFDISGHKSSIKYFKPSEWNQLLGIQNNDFVILFSFNWDLFWVRFHVLEDKILGKQISRGLYLCLKIFQYSEGENFWRHGCIRSIVAQLWTHTYKS